MGQLNINVATAGDEITINVMGHIDEDADFTSTELKGSKITFDLEKVETINSCGIREWIKWIKSSPEASKIVYKNCPKVIVDQVNMVAGFLPNNGSIESFYVPYYSEESGDEKMILFNHGVEFNGSNITPPDGIKDDDGEEMEMDVIEAKYFKFLQG
ncbi:MAG: hypothetical protein HOO06_13130 [Bdellovibrionaceae bacterium]|jgi:hypothetical protein|nr:hypothetical protein [Pseudobdellovibrionaceae bacterium]